MHKLIIALRERAERTVELIKGCENIGYGNTALYEVYDLWCSEEYVNLEKAVKKSNEALK